MVRINHRIFLRAPIQRCFDLARSVEVHLLRNYHSNAPAAAVAGLTSGLAGLGQQTTWRARHFSRWHQLTSEITAFRAPVYFQDTMQSGIFRSMQHGHYFRLLPSGLVEMEDTLCFAAPILVLGSIAEVLFLRRYMQKLLAERCCVIKEVAESDEWKRYIPQEEESCGSS